MKRLIIFLIFIFIFCVGCSQEHAGILFNHQPINADNIYNYSRNFSIGSRIYYVILMPKKVESRYIYIQIIKKDNEYGQYGYDLIQTRNIRLKDEEVNYFTDYCVLNQKGTYVMQVYSKDNPHKVMAEAEFYVGM